MKYFSYRCAFWIVLTIVALLAMEGGNLVLVQAATVPTITLPQKTITLYNVEIGFQNMKMSAFRVIDEPAYKRIGILLGDSLLFKAVLTPDVPLSYEKFLWSGEQTGTGQMISSNFTHAGQNSESVTVGGKTKTAVTTAVAIDSLNQVAWCGLHLPSCYTANSDGDEAYEWALYNEFSLGGGFSSSGKADAARHTYWNALMVVDGLSFNLAVEASTAHEQSNINNGDPHNETVMDLENNSDGASIGASLGVGAARSAVDSAVRSALSAGTLTILDGIGNANEYGLLKPSNK